jgi:ABC-type maltose transport system permease subunit
MKALLNHLRRLYSVKAHLQLFKLRGEFQVVNEDLEETAIVDG